MKEKGLSAQSGKSVSALTPNPDLRCFVFEQDKHTRALVSWLKSRKKDVHDLSVLFAEGSTVAHEIWRLYDVEGWPDYSKYRDEVICAAERVRLLRELAEEARHLDGLSAAGFSGWLRQKAEEMSK